MCVFLLILMKGGGMYGFMWDIGIVMLFSNAPEHLKWGGDISITSVRCVWYKILSRDQRWAKGPIDRFSDTDSIFRLYRTIQSIDAKFRFLYRPIVSVRFEFRFFNRPILFLGLKFRFFIGRLCRFVLSSDFLIVRSCFLVLSSDFCDFCIVRLYRPVLSYKTNAVKMVGNGLAGPSKMDFVEAFMGGPVLS